MIAPRRFPITLVRRGYRRCLRRQRQQRAEAGLRLLRGRAWAAVALERYLHPAVAVKGH
jgi:hypothetical protein